MGAPRLQSMTPDASTFSVIKRRRRSETTSRALRSTDLWARTSLVGHTSKGPAALGQVYDHKPDKQEADVGGEGEPHAQ